MPQQRGSLSQSYKDDSFRNLSRQSQEPTRNHFLPNRRNSLKPREQIKKKKKSHQCLLQISAYNRMLLALPVILGNISNHVLVHLIKTLKGFFREPHLGPNTLPSVSVTPE